MNPRMLSVDFSGYFWNWIEKDYGNQSTDMIIASEDSGHDFSYERSSLLKCITLTSCYLTEKNMTTFFNLLYDHEKLRLKMMGKLTVVNISMQPSTQTTAQSLWLLSSKFLVKTEDKTHIRNIYKTIVWLK